MVITHKSVREAILEGDSASKIIKTKLQNVPYDQMFQLDESIYGKDIILAHIVKDKDWKGDQKYDILTKDGVLLGRFDMEHKGYYNPTQNPYNKNARLPEEANLQDIVARYCAVNPETIEHIPEETHKKFPNLAKTIVNEIDSQKKGTNDKAKTNSKVMD